MIRKQVGLVRDEIVRPRRGKVTVSLALALEALGCQVFTRKGAQFVVGI
jgi:hypothetical protein